MVPGASPGMVSHLTTAPHGESFKAGLQKHSKHVASVGSLLTQVQHDGADSGMVLPGACSAVFWVHGSGHCSVLQWQHATLRGTNSVLTVCYEITHGARCSLCNCTSGLQVVRQHVQFRPLCVSRRAAEARAVYHSGDVPFRGAVMCLKLIDRGL